MFGRGRKKTRTRIEPRLEWRAGGARRRRSSRRSRRPAADQPQAERAASSRSASGREARDGAVRSSATSSIGASCSRSGACVFLAALFRLLREPAAADRPARGAQAAAQHRHPRRRRLADRQSRRHGRRRGQARRSCRPICRRRSSPSRTGASTTITASIRSASPRALLRNVIGGGGIAGRLDADPAARQEPVPDPGAHALAQDPGGDPGVLARAQLLQGPDPRTLSEPRLFRLRRLRGRSGGAEIFRQERAVRDPVGGRDARRAR